MLRSKAISNVLMSFFIAGLCIYWGLSIYKSPINQALATTLYVIIIIVFLVGVYMFSVSLTRLLLPDDEVFDDISFEEDNKQQLIEISGKKSYNKKTSIVAISSILYLFTTTIVYQLFKNEYNEKEFEANGIVKKVFIESSSRGKSTTYLHFKYEFNGTLFDGKLKKENQNVGDSATIIFSTHNLYIIKWNN